MNAGLPNHLKPESLTPFFHPEHGIAQLKDIVSGVQNVRWLPLRFGSNSHPDSTEEAFADSGARQSYEFDGVLLAILARIVNLAPERIDDEIQHCLARVCEFLKLERAGVWRNSQAETGSFKLSHQWVRKDSSAPHAPNNGFDNIAPDWFSQAPKLEPIPLGTESKACFPWISVQVNEARKIVFSRLKELPTEAAADKEALFRLCMRACAIIPIMVQGKVLGAVSFEIGEERVWPKLLLRELELVAEVLASAIERKNTESLLRESEARFRVVADCAPVLIWMSSTDKQCNFFNKPWLEFTGRTLEQEMGNRWAEGVHPDDLLHCFQTYEKAFDARRPFLMEYRLRRRDGQYRWISDNGVPRYEADGNFAGYIGSCVDITERKLADEALVKSYAEIKQLKDRLQAESDYLKTEIKVSHAHGSIIGRTQSIKKVFHQVEQVAPVDCPVLISGETGTGKELIAQEIHRLSPRRDRVMVLVNCAALPSALVESELFGRERGAYTGALTSQVGRFEVANGSTIFLDEVGELSMEVQAKLLRVLQQGEFQRLGSPKTHRVNVRIIAATNRDLAAEVRKGTFREDLYYRLRVFPIEIPPLRERVEDIPLLAFAFMEEFSTRMGKKVTKVHRKAMETLQRHSWPGNIRELRNVIEHSVILSAGDMLKLSALGDAPTRDAQPVTLAEAEREHILKVLESTGWRIKGPHGAAQKLDLHSSTLYSRMQKLGVPHRRQKDEMATEG
jgi:PAS domain S-box-containing protein